MNVRIFLSLTRLAFMLLLVSLSACLDQSERQPKAKQPSARTKESPSQSISIYVANYPLQYFAKRIGGEKVKVSFPAERGGDPAFWQPTVEQISALQGADLILLNGASYEKWLPHVTLPSAKLVDTSSLFAEQYISSAGGISHSHGSQVKHQHGELAFTTWLDPLQAISQARAVRDSLARLRPQLAEEFSARFSELEQDLVELDKKFTEIFQNKNSEPLIFSHPVYQYFIRRYGLTGLELHWEPDEVPTAEQFEELQLALKKYPASSMIWEGTPNSKTIEKLKQLGLNSLLFDPCANRPEIGDYLSVMKENVDRLAKAQ